MGIAGFRLLEVYAFFYFRAFKKNVLSKQHQISLNFSAGNRNTDTKKNHKRIKQKARELLPSSLVQDTIS